MAIKPPPKLALNTCRATSRAKSNTAAETISHRLSSSSPQHGGPANFGVAVLFLYLGRFQLVPQRVVQEKNRTLRTDPSQLPSTLRASRASPSRLPSRLPSKLRASRASRV